MVCHARRPHSAPLPPALTAPLSTRRLSLLFLRNLSLSHSFRDFKERAVKGGDTVDLGGGHVIEFVMAPNLHWPDTMFSYDHATGVMYTCDAFGMHYCTEEPFDADVGALMPHYRCGAAVFLRAVVAMPHTQARARRSGVPEPRCCCAAVRFAHPARLRCTLLASPACAGSTTTAS